MVTIDGKVFVPFSEDVVAQLGVAFGELVPFDLDYECLRLADSNLKNEGWLEVAIERDASPREHIVQ